MIPLDPPLSALAALDPRHLLGFTMKLLDLPANGTHLSPLLGRILSQVVRHDVSFVTT